MKTIFVVDEEAVEIIKDGSGKHFDPELVKIFLLCEKEFNGVTK